MVRTRTNDSFILKYSGLSNRHYMNRSINVLNSITHSYNLREIYGLKVPKRDPKIEIIIQNPSSSKREIHNI